jgi:GT2 family glycosyltransferase
LRFNLSIIIVTYNSRRHIDECLSSVLGTSPAVDREVIVVDNASEDGTAAAVRGRWPTVRVIDAGSNLGFAKANNVGIRQSSGELVLLLNPDTRIRPGALDTMVSALTARSDIGVVGPRIVDGAGRAELSFGSMIGPVSELRQKLLARLQGYVERVTRTTRTVDWVSGACLLVGRADADAVGLLDERFFMYAEDVDFCAAVRATGKRVLFLASAEVVHLRGQSVASRPAATEAAYRRSQLAFYEKYRPGWVPMLRGYLKLRGRLPDTPIDPRVPYP